MSKNIIYDLWNDYCNCIKIQTNAKASIIKRNY
jgi:hypothetical protein